MIQTHTSRRMLATVALAAGGGLAAAVNPIVGLIAGGLIGAAVLASASWLLVPVLILASALDRLSIPIVGGTLRPDVIVALLATLILVNGVLVRTVPLSTFRSPLTWPLILYVAVNVLSTLLFAVEKTRGLSLDAEIVSAVLGYLVLLALLRTPQSLDSAIDVMWAVTVAEAGIGLLLVAFYVGGLSTVGVQLGDFGLPMAYGTQYEANIFGSFLLGNFFILLADYLRRRSDWRLAGLALILLGIAASLTRTVWIALVLGLMFFGATLLRRRDVGARLLPVLAGLPALILIGFLAGTATPVAGRLLDLVNLRSSSAAGRSAIFGAALQDWKSHPLLGLGTGSFNFGAASGQPHPWLPNLTLLTLHDTGIVGLAILILLVASFLVTSLRAVGNQHSLSLLVAGSMAGFTALLIAFQTTTGFWFIFPWIVAAIGMAACRLLETQP